MDWGSFAAGALAASVLLTAERALRRYRASLPAELAAPTVEPFADLGGKKAARPATAPLAFLEGMPVEMVAARLNLEHPYLTAYVLEHLPATTRDRVLAMLGAGPRRDVQELLGRGEPLKLSGEAFVELLARLRAA